MSGRLGRVYHLGTLPFRARIPLPRLRLWKNQCPHAGPRLAGGVGPEGETVVRRSQRSQPCTGKTLRFRESAGPARHATCTSVDGAVDNERGR
jgi:hypothetical protein